MVLDRVVSCDIALRLENGMDNRSTADRLLDSTVLIAAGTLLLYLIAANYLRGYLEFYSAQAFWFNPSVFQLMSFSFFPIVVALILCAGFAILLWPNLLSRGGWWLIYIAWSVAITGVSFFDFAGRHPHAIMTRAVLAPAVIPWFLTLVTPPATACWAKYCLRRQSKQKPLNPEALARLTKSIRTGAAFTVLFLIWLLTGEAHRVGFATATYDHALLSTWRATLPKNEKAASGIIFSDASSSYIVFEISAESERYYFRNAPANINLNLSVAGSMETFIPNTPNTLPSPSTPASAPQLSN